MPTDPIRTWTLMGYWPVEGCDSGQIIAVNALGCDERSVRVADAAAAVAALDRIEAALAFDERRPWLITQQAADARRALRGLREAISGE